MSLPSTATLTPLHVIPRRGDLRYTERFSESYLDDLRTQGDPLADRIIAQFAATNSLRNYHDLLGEVRERAKREDGIYAEFLSACNDVPAWADFAAMEAGQRMIGAFPAHMGLALFAGSLVGGAVFRKMTIVTAMTGMLSGDPSRRLNETGAMVLRMAFPNALQPGCSAHELLMRVRLLHSAVRHYLIQSGRFKHPTEVPINQQDLAITLALFGYFNVRSLARMGIRFSEQELASFTLLWRYAGYVLGIREDLLPVSMRDQQEFFFACLKHQALPEKMSPEIKCLLDHMAKSFTKRIPGLPFGTAQKFLHQSCRYLCGNEYVTGMQIEDAGDDYWGIQLLKGLGSAGSLAQRYLPLGSELLYRAGTVIVRGTLAEIKRERDVEGEYRVRTADRAAHGANKAA